MTVAITLENLTVAYGHHVALHDVSATLEEGSLTAVAGPNGSGKSTLLKTIAGILKPQKGQVHVVHETLAYLPQTQSIRRDFPMSVEQAVATGFYPKLGDVGKLGRKRRAKVIEALSEVGLAGYEKHQISALSGGQFQRMLFARLILQNAQIILLDEPFTAVDAETTARLIQILLKWHREGRTVICVLHDLMLIQKYFPDSMVLAGKCLGRGHTHKMFQQKLLSYDLDMAELCSDAKHAATHHHGHDHDHGSHG